MKAIHNDLVLLNNGGIVVLYPKDTEKWKQFTTPTVLIFKLVRLCCIPKIPKNESNSQRYTPTYVRNWCCVVSQRYRKMKAIHNDNFHIVVIALVVLYPKDTEKWKQFTTHLPFSSWNAPLCCIPKIPKNESNSQRRRLSEFLVQCCVVSQRYRKMKAIHNSISGDRKRIPVVLYPKDTEKWKQFTTWTAYKSHIPGLCCIPKIPKNESNSQQASEL